MATEKANAEVSNTHTDGNQEKSAESSSNSKEFTAPPRFGKALAHRALYGSSSRRAGSRKVRDNDTRTLPSRLSNVSLADDEEN
ncbi:conserved hypothetical protein [Ricinus communis]|uniref:Uncharacterized protein n=1 Tax=Ricinus communis TaxID=3988 RepID=B9RNI0_RICCO|nr:conserved hypothetical protein [Ricinus communis]